MLLLHSEKIPLLALSNAKLHQMLIHWNPQKISSQDVKPLVRTGEEKKQHLPQNVLLQHNVENRAGNLKTESEVYHQPENTSQHKPVSNKVFQKGWLCIFLTAAGGGRGHTSLELEGESST